MMAPAQQGQIVYELGIAIKVDISEVGSNPVRTPVVVAEPRVVPRDLARERESRYACVSSVERRLELRMVLCKPEHECLDFGGPEGGRAEAISVAGNNAIENALH